MSDIDEMDEMIKDFLIESYENLDRLDQDFIALEEAPDDAERMKSIFRTIHTIKGTCGFLDFGKLGYVGAAQSHVCRALDVGVEDVIDDLGRDDAVRGGPV